MLRTSIVFCAFQFICNWKIWKKLVCLSLPEWIKKTRLRTQWNADQPKNETNCVIVTNMHKPMKNKSRPDRQMLHNLICGINKSQP